MSDTGHQRSTDPSENRSQFYHFWSFVWVGTAVSGWVGVFLGGPIGLLMGPVFVGYASLPVIASLAVLSWALWLDRYPIRCGAISGGLVGFLWPLLLMGGIPIEIYGRVFLLISTTSGAIAAWFAARQFFRQEFAAELLRHRQSAAWQFSIQDMLFRMAVIAALLAAWGAVIRLFTE